MTFIVENLRKARDFTAKACVNLLNGSAADITYGGDVELANTCVGLCTSCSKFEI